MKKVLFSIIIIAGTALTCFAQQPKDMRAFSVGLSLGLPVGSATDIYNYTSAVTAKYEFPTNSNTLKITATSGLDIFSVKNPIVSGKKDTFLPLEGGLKIYLSRFYVEGDAGASINTNTNYAGHSVGLMYAPTVGFSIPSLDMQEVDFSLRYEGRVTSGGNSINQVAFRVAYKFDFFKRVF